MYLMCHPNWPGKNRRTVYLGRQTCHLLLRHNILSQEKGRCSMGRRHLFQQGPESTGIRVAAYNASHLQQIATPIK